MIRSRLYLLEPCGICFFHVVGTLDLQSGHDMPPVHGLALSPTRLVLRLARILRGQREV